MDAVTDRSATTPANLQGGGFTAKAVHSLFLVFLQTLAPTMIPTIAYAILETIELEP